MTAEGIIEVDTDSVCPYCGSDALIETKNYLFNNELAELCFCENCKGEFEFIYKLIGYRNTAAVA